jgi:hypothetical protein
MSTDRWFRLEALLSGQVDRRPAAHVSPAGLAPHAGMSYEMPAYSRDGFTEIGWASQKRYISLYVLRGDVLDAHRGQLAHLSVGKGCIRYRNPAEVDFAVVRSILSAVAASRGPPVPFTLSGMSGHPARYPLRICSLRMSACPQCWASSRSTWR